MSGLRVTIVAPWAWARSPRRSFVVGSGLVHLLFTAAVVWLPELWRGPPIPPDATVVELVGALPASSGPPAAPPGARAEQEPEPEGATLATPPPARPSPPPEREPKPEPKKPPKPPSTPAPSVAPAPAAETPPGPGGGGSATAGSASAGASISSLEGGDSTFGWYRASVTQALYTHWQRPILESLVEPVGVRVTFEILRDGSIRGLHVEESSGVPSLDRSALRAVSDAAPLPPLPASLGEPALPASFVFRLYPDGG